MAAGVFASASESARPAVGDGFPDEDVSGRGNGSYSCERGHGITGWPWATSPSVDKAARMSMGDVGKATGIIASAGESVGRRFRHSHRMTAVVIASAEKSARTIVGDIVADEAAGRRRSGTGDRRRK